jgi:hypothetical protein
MVNEGLRVSRVERTVEDVGVTILYSICDSDTPEHEAIHEARTALGIGVRLGMAT